MKQVKGHPFITILLLTILGMVIGAGMGNRYATREVQSIAQGIRQENPKDPLDGLWIIALGYFLEGAAIGTAVGIASGISLVVYVKHRAKYNPAA